MRIFFLTLALILCFYKIEAQTTWETKGQGVSVKMTLSANAITINDTLKITLELIYPDSYQPNLPLLRKNLLSYSGIGIAPFALIHQNVNQTQKYGDDLKQIITFELEPMLPGVHHLSFQEIHFQSQQGKDISLISDIFEVKVTLPPAPKQNPMSLATPLMPLTKTIPLAINTENKKTMTLQEESAGERNFTLLKEKALPWIGFALIFFLATLYLITKTSPERPLISKEAMSRAIKKARTKAQLAIEKLPKDNYSQFISSLANIVRSFIEDRYQLNAPTLTTPEFLETMSQHPILTENSRKQLIQFLESSDQVKFAQYQPTKEQCTHAKEEALDFIKE